MINQEFVESVKNNKKIYITSSASNFSFNLSQYVIVYLFGVDDVSHRYFINHSLQKFTSPVDYTEVELT